MDDTQKWIEELRAIKDRLSVVESRLSLSSPRPEAPKPAVPAPPAVATHRPSAPLPLPPETSGDSGTGRFLGIAAVICFVLAAAFLVKLSIDAGWLTPLRRIMLSAVFGFSLIAAGTKSRAKDKSYFSLLPAAGIVVLYLTVAAGRGLYDLYPPEVAVAIMSAVSVLCLVLFSLFRTDLYVGVAVIGSYFSSCFIDRDLDMASFTTYFLIWDVTFAVVSVMLRSRAMILLSSYLSLGLYQILLPASVSPDPRSLTFVACVQFLQFLIFTVATGAYAIKNRVSMTSAQAWAFFPILLFFYGLEYALLNRAYPDLAPWIALGFAAIVYGVYALTKQSLGQESLGSAGTVSTFVSLVMVHAVYFEILPSRWQVVSGVLVLALLPAMIKVRGEKRWHLGPMLCLGLVVLLGYIRTVMAADDLARWEYISIGMLFTAFLGGGYLNYRRGSEETTERYWIQLALIFAHAQFLVASYRLWGEIQSRAQISDGLMGGLVSTTWGLFGVATLLWAKRRRDTFLAYSSLGILAVATLKVFLVDVASAPPVVRVVCLMAMGAILYFCGYLMRTIGRWSKDA